MIAVLPGRRILKVVLVVRAESKPCRCAGQPAIGTKRRRVVKSGADEQLEQESAEDEDDDVHILLDAQTIKLKPCGRSSHSSGDGR